MILDTLANWRRYFASDIADLPGLYPPGTTGRHGPARWTPRTRWRQALCHGQRISDRTLSVKLYEAHRRYIDLQYLVEGRETIYWRPVERLDSGGGLRIGPDIVFFRDAAGSALLLEPGLFVVFYPDDAHKPGCHTDVPEQVRKIVVKILVD